MSDPEELSVFQRHILAVLAEEPRYGLGIKKTLEKAGYGDVNHGRLYPNINEMVDAGYVAKRPLDRRTNEYRLTPDGQERLTELLCFEAQFLPPEDFRTGVMTDGQADGLAEVDAGP